MNKFGIFLILLLTIEISTEIDLDDKTMEGIYDKLLLIIQGMSINEKGNCLTLLTEKKENFIVIFNKLISAFLNGEELKGLIGDIINFIVSLGIKDYTTLDNDCHIMKLFNLYTSFKNDNTRIKFFEDMGTNISKNSTIIQKEGSRFVFKRGINEKIVLIGKMARPILNITMT